MLKKLFLSLGGLVIGAVIGYFVSYQVHLSSIKSPINLSDLPGFSHKKVIGFLPYWLTNRAKKDYSKYINTLTYYGLTIDTDGSILKLANEQEGEPGWIALRDGKMDSFFSAAKQKKVNLSLLVFSGNEDTISQLISDPIPHANTLVKEALPIMNKYGFSDLNVDIESGRVASDEARLHFTQFMQTVKKGLDKNNSGSLTLDVSPTAFIKKFLINPAAVAPYTDYQVIMAYDYHYQGSAVSGPVSPLSGAGTTSEFDVKTGLQQALQVLPPEKVILGIPLYGYEWETINNSPRSPVIPGTGQIASNNRVETFLENCATCSAQYDNVDQELHVIYKDENTGSFHQLFYPDKQSTTADLKLADEYDINGVAMWALGYEGNSILNPIQDYKNSH